jgi:hypothetical protein
MRPFTFFSSGSYVFSITGVTPELELITEIPSCASDLKNDSESASENKNKNKAFGKKFKKESDRLEEIISKSP